MSNKQTSESFWFLEADNDIVLMYMVVRFQFDMSEFVAGSDPEALGDEDII